MSDWSTVLFRKSSRSSTNGGQCVEVGFRPGLVAVRDSKCPAGGLIVLPATTWAEALSALQTS
ncbi:hypothetical protein JOD54_006661 [Actinokineospora baliensis]|uniref:DUF397 domain-containing protein n=1 Tax=Actinokineospora baliensis TaxID=547056 RepID=UPI00195B737D|nr:DUF397 domain-containing protein [Actinokineospora baliensis]MBM7776457.1 hypothetical protein [Actinokineospora baliensis]